MEKDLRPEELRIGNIIESNTGLIKIIGLPFGRHFECEPYPHKMEDRRPIASVKRFVFNEDWLPKIGLADSKIFNKSNDAEVFYFNCGPYNKLSFRKLNPEGQSIKLIDSNNHQLVINSLHHLQNVFYALTGTDLEIDYFINV